MHKRSYGIQAHNHPVPRENDSNLIRCMRNSKLHASKLTLELKIEWKRAKCNMKNQQVSPFTVRPSPLSERELIISCTHREAIESDNILLIDKPRPTSANMVIFTTLSTDSRESLRDFRWPFPRSKAATLRI